MVVKIEHLFIPCLSYASVLIIRAMTAVALWFWFEIIINIHLCCQPEYQRQPINIRGGEDISLHEEKYIFFLFSFRILSFICERNYKYLSGWEFSLGSLFTHYSVTCQTNATNNCNDDDNDNLTEFQIFSCLHV